MEKAEFKNTSRGVVGAIVIEPGKKPRGIAVQPGDTVWLTEEEQIATANAPKKAENNPFVNGSLTLVTEPQEIVNRRPIGFSEGQQVPATDEEREAIEKRKAEEEAARVKHEEEEAARQKAKEEADAETQERERGTRPVIEEVGLGVEPVGDGPKGERAANEEVATPAAKPKPKAVKTA
jgi:hypothetical protein